MQLFFGLKKINKNLTRTLF